MRSALLLTTTFAHIGEGSEALFAAFHPAERVPKRDAVCLLCNPFGEEAMRAHRLYRVLATQLARAGYPTLRFDYLGTGDSAGEAAQVGLEGWLDSVERAAAEACRLAGTKRLIAVGLRLGGTLAALASTRRGLHLRHLALWDPVVDGTAYLHELARSHREHMHAIQGDAFTSSLVVDADGFPDQALGAPVPAALAASLAAIDLGTEDALRADRVSVLATVQSPELERFRERLPALAAVHEWVATSTSVPWNSDAALNQAVVPRDVLNTLVNRIQVSDP